MFVILLQENTALSALYQLELQGSIKRSRGVTGINKTKKRSYGVTGARIFEAHGVMKPEGMELWSRRSYEATSKKVRPLACPDVTKSYMLFSTIYVSLQYSLGQKKSIEKQITGKSFSNLNHSMVLPDPTQPGKNQSI